MQSAAEDHLFFTTSIIILCVQGECKRFLPFFDPSAEYNVENIPQSRPQNVGEYVIQLCVSSFCEILTNFDQQAGRTSHTQNVPKPPHLYRHRRQQYTKREEQQYIFQDKSITPGTAAQRSKRYPSIPSLLPGSLDKKVINKSIQRYPAKTAAARKELRRLPACPRTFAMITAKIPTVRNAANPAKKYFPTSVIS